MRGNDWNNNGKYDNFDQFIDFDLMTGTGDDSNDTDKTSNSNSAKKQAQNDDIPLSRSLLVIALCIGAIFVPLDFEGGKLVRDIIPLCVSVLGHKILKK